MYHVLKHFCVSYNYVHLLGEIHQNILYYCWLLRFVKDWFCSAQAHSYAFVLVSRMRQERTCVCVFAGGGGGGGGGGGSGIIKADV